MPGVKAMPGSIPAPDYGSFENKKMQVATEGTPKNIYKRVHYVSQIHIKI